MLRLRKVKQVSASLTYAMSKREHKAYSMELKIWEVPQIFKTRNLSYEYFHNYFWHKSPQWLRDHRHYFRVENRGFGEDAFHAFWYIVMRDLKPQKCLEIGVYRGQVISLWALIARKLQAEVEVHGISPFSNSGDNVSCYPTGIDYYQDTVENFSVLDIPKPLLHRGFSTDPAMLQVIASCKWDLVYVDGNHEYDVVKSDVLACSRSLSTTGLIVLDDSSLHTHFTPPKYASKGHVGPSQVGEEMGDLGFDEFVSVGHLRAFLPKRR